MSATFSPSFDADILAELVGADRGELDESTANAILKLRFTDKQVAEMDELLDRNNKGVLTPKEREKMEGYRRVGRLIDMWQAKARRSLAKPT